MSAVVEDVARPVNAVATMEPVTPMQMLSAAVARGTDMAQLEKLLDLQERWEKNNARKEFVAAMAAFKANPPTIVKDKLVGYENKDGSYTGYKHATLAEVATKIAAGLAAVGISHSWDVKHEGRMVIVSCTLTHASGHSETVTMPPVSPDDSGKKNPIQQVASAITYQQRYSLLAITGLAAADQDDDGKGGGKVEEVITEKQAADLDCLLTETNSDKALFLKWAKVDSLNQILAKNFKFACDEVRARAKARAR